MKQNIVIYRVKGRGQFHKDEDRKVATVDSRKDVQHVGAFLSMGLTFRSLTLAAEPTMRKARATHELATRNQLIKQTTELMAVDSSSHRRRRQARCPADTWVKSDSMRNVVIQLTDLQDREFKQQEL
jgi:hypothetical protein